jgi:hypothetical protein
MAAQGEQALAQWRENDAKNKRDATTFSALLAQQAAEPATEEGARDDVA